MDFSTVFLLFVLYALEVAVHSQTYPYISFMGVSLRNNSYVDGNLVGDNSTHSVQCHTDLSTCCSSTEGIHRAGWSFPSGQTLGFINTGWGRVYMKRAAQRVELRRRNDLRIKGNGMYRCSIRTTAASDRVFVYVGLYTSGGDVTMQNITLTVNTDSERANVIYTFTCISTGGPATIVTWTRDYVVIPEGERTTVLDSSESARYIHNLTLTRILDGIYDCTVSNNKPSQDSAQLRIQSPTSLLVSVSSSHSTVMAGESITLTCSVTIPYGLNGIPEVQWKGPRQIPNPTSPSVVSGQELTSTLTLSAIRTSQAGQYTCTASLTDFNRNDSKIVVVQVPSPEVKLFGVSSGSTRVLGSSVSLTCTIQRQGGHYVDTPTTVKSSWDAPNNIYSGDNEDNVTSVDLNIASLGTADSGVYRCSANVVDSSGNEYIADSSTATASESIVIKTLFQLHLKGIASCSAFLGDETITKIYDITSALIGRLHYSCMCNITKDNVAHEPFLVCSDASSHFVTYRSGVSATSDDVGSQMLVSYIEDWVSSGPTVHVRGTLMKIDNKCSVSITSYVDDLCADVATTASEIPASTSTNKSQQPTDISGAIVGGILSVLVIAISQVVLVVLLWRGCHGKQLFRKTEQYPLMSMPGHSEMELSAVFTTSNAAYELTAPLEENLYDYISPMDMHQGNTAVKPPSLPKERESGYVISGLYDYQAASPKDIDDGYVIPSLEVPTNSNKGSPPFLSEDREDGYVIANLHQPLQTALLSQDSTNKATSDLSLPPAAQERENAVSELPTAAPQLQNSEKELRKKTHAMTDMHNLSPDDNLPHETTDDEIMSTTVSQLLNKEGKICDCSLEL